jgi:hypothetical protein
LQPKVDNQFTTVKQENQQHLEEIETTRTENMKSLQLGLAGFTQFFTNRSTNQPSNSTDLSHNTISPSSGLINSHGKSERDDAQPT